MDAFEAELMRRSPLAGCVLELGDHMFDEPFLREVYDANRGRCYQDTLTFGDFLTLVRDALVRHGGSAHALFVELEAAGAEPVDESNFYRKLARTPAAVSRALLREGTARLATVMPGPATALPSCFDAFAVVIGDGKKIKDAARRLAPTRGFTGSLIGARALVGIDARTGLAVDRSADACGVARGNLADQGFVSRSLVLQGDWAAALPAHRFDVVVSNPPYIESGVIPGLDRDVREHDPMAALDGGPDGLDCYRVIAADLPRLLAPGGLAGVEVGQGQNGDVARLITTAGLVDVATRPDLGGITRAVLARQATDPASSN